MENSPLSHGRGLNASQLKSIAIVAMIIDHIAWEFVPVYSWLGASMHFVGRITGPIMFYFIVEGYHYTRNKNRYTLRLAVFALISYLPFYYFEYGRLPGSGGFAPVGVIYTLLLGLLALRARHEVKNKTVGFILMASCVLASVIGDWPIMGVVLVVLFDTYRGNFKNQAMTAGIAFLLTILPDFIGGLVLSESQGVISAGIQMGQFLPLALLSLYNGQRGGSKNSKWFFYIIYPLHLLVLGLIKFELLPLLS